MLFGVSATGVACQSVIARYGVRMGAGLRPVTAVASRAVIDDASTMTMAFHLRCNGRRGCRRRGRGSCGASRSRGGWSRSGCGASRSRCGGGGCGWWVYLVNSRADPFVGATAGFEIVTAKLLNGFVWYRLFLLHPPISNLCFTRYR